MSETYIVINGKKAELTEKQLKALGIEVETKRKNPFERVSEGERYFYTTSNGADGALEEHDAFDDDFFENADYFNDDRFAKQVALHQLLYRKLLKFAYDNECEDTAEWDEGDMHWAIRYVEKRGTFTACLENKYKAQEVYFSSADSAERAIEEVVKPFVKEHPEFVW